MRLYINVAGMVFILVAVWVALCSDRGTGPAVQPNTSRDLHESRPRGEVSGRPGHLGVSRTPFKGRSCLVLPIS
jgi:hypothetical protein